MYSKTCNPVKITAKIIVVSKATEASNLEPHTIELWQVEAPEDNNKRCSKKLFSKDLI
jgi:hypothetical protein